MLRISFAAGVAVVLLLAGMATSAEAQSLPQRVRGTIDHVSADTITIQAADGTAKAKLAPDARIVFGPRPRPYRHQGRRLHRDSRRETARRPPSSHGGTVFPPEMRGVGEGQRPWDQGPNSSMTNANVDEIVRAGPAAR